MKCPQCGYDNPEGATHCAQCEIDLQVGLPQPASITEAASQAKSNPDIVYCAKCGAENKAGYRHCIKCATLLITLTAPTPKQRETKVPSADLPSPPAMHAREREPTAEAATTTTPAGDGLGALGALVVLVAFFLPWVRACGQPMSAWQLANEATVQGKEQFYLTPVAAVLALLFIGWVMSRSAVMRGQAGRIIFILATVGVLPALDLLYSIYTRGRGSLEPMYGLWLTLAGFGALFAGAIMEIQTGTAHRMPTSPICAGCGTKNPPINRHCQACGATLPGVGAESAGLRTLHVLLAAAAGLFGLLLLLGAGGLAADPQAQAMAGNVEGLGGELVLLAAALGAGILLSFALYRDQGT